MKIYSLDVVNNFSVQNNQNSSYKNILNFSKEKLPQYNRLSFMASPLINKYSSDFYGLTLLNQTSSLNKNSKKYDDAIEFIQNAACEKLYTNPKIKPLKSKNPVIWSVTSEFAPIKEGGLGSVPPEIRNNAKKLGVNIPTFVPMYLNEGNSTFIEENGRCTYNKNGIVFPLESVVAFKMDTFQEGKIQTIPIEIYLYEDDKKGQLIFIKADKYFDGTIYEPSLKSEESEKFAVFSKAVYEFLKLKTEGPKALKEVHLASSNALYKIKEPDGMMLNDWQASPVAALMRYKAPMENAYNKLSDETAQKLKNMTIATIGHNCMYQGSSKDNNNQKQKVESSNNILNTLFDRYANDIVKNAKTCASVSDIKDKSLENLDNSLVINYKNPSQNSVNFLNMGVILSDFFLPVSKNYAKELVNPKKNDLSGPIQWALVQKEKSNRMIGIINGNDRKNLHIEAVAKNIKKTTGLDFKTYNSQTSAEDIIELRKENKFNLYNNYMRPATDSKGVSPELSLKVKNIASGIEFYKGVNSTTLPQIDKEIFDKTPVLSLAGRLVSQKGIDVAVDAIEKLYKNWEKEFPDQEKPIIYIAGADNEGGAQRKKIEELIDKKLSQIDASRIVFAHDKNIPMNAIMAGSDFFLMPSKFEPCGLTQGEAMAKGTPVIAAAVGGIVDTVNRSGKHTGVLTDKNAPLTSDEFYSAIVDGLDIYFYEKDEYQKMVTDALSEDFSWVQKGKQGPVYDYLELFGISRENLSDIN